MQGQNYQAFEKGIFLFEQVKEEPRNVQGEFAVEDESNFIQKIKSILKNISSSLFNEFFESSLVDYVEYLINLKNTTENKEFATEAKNRISSLKNRIKKNERKGKKSVDEHQESLKKFLITIDRFKKFLHQPQKLIKQNHNQNLKKVLQRG